MSRTKFHGDKYIKGKWEGRDLSPIDSRESWAYRSLPMGYGFKENTITVKDENRSKKIYILAWESRNYLLFLTGCFWRGKIVQMKSGWAEQ